MGVHGDLHSNKISHFFPAVFPSIPVIFSSSLFFFFATKVSWALELPQQFVRQETRYLWSCGNFQRPTFQGWVTGTAVLGGLEAPHGFQQSLIFLLAPCEGAIVPGKRYNHATWRFAAFGAFFRGWSQQDSPRQPGTFWSCGRAIAAGISPFWGKLTRHLWLREFQCCGLCPRSVAPWPLREKQPVTCDSCVSLTIKVHKHRRGSEQKPIWKQTLAVFENSCVWPLERWSLRSTTFVLPIRVSSSWVCSPSPVNSSSRYLNFSTCCSILSLACGVYCLV